MSLTPIDLRTALETYIEFGPQSSRPAADRLRERRPALQQSQIEAALAEAQLVVRTAEQLVRELKAGNRNEASITPALRQQFPWLASDAVPPRRWLGLLRRPAEDLSIRVRGYAYFLDAM